MFQNEMIIIVKLYKKKNLKLSGNDYRAAFF